MAVVGNFTQYPSDKIVRGIDWTTALSNANNGTSADTIASAVWTADSGLTLVPALNGNVTLVEITGGTELASYILRVTVTLTTSGQIISKEIHIRMLKSQVTG